MNGMYIYIPSGEGRNANRKILLSDSIDSMYICMYSIISRDILILKDLKQELCNNLTE